MSIGMVTSTDLREASRKIQVDHCIPIRHYYSIADNLLKQANIQRQINNTGDLYLLLLRYTSLLTETIPLHQDYKEKKSYKKTLPDLLRELERLRPQVEGEIARQKRVQALKEQNQLNLSIDQDFSQESQSRLTLDIRRPDIPETVPSAPPIESLVINDDTPAVLSSSTTENLSNRHDEGSSNTAGSSCIICYEAPIEGACVPCGHMAGCISCLNEIKAKSWGCPVCRTKIELVLRVYAV